MPTPHVCAQAKVNCFPTPSDDLPSHFFAPFSTSKPPIPVDPELLAQAPLLENTEELVKIEAGRIVVEKIVVGRPAQPQQENVSQDDNYWPTLEAPSAELHAADFNHASLSTVWNGVLDAPNTGSTALLPSESSHTPLAQDFSELNCAIEYPGLFPSPESYLWATHSVINNGVSAEHDGFEGQMRDRDYAQNRTSTDQSQSDAIKPAAPILYCPSPPTTLSANTNSIELLSTAGLGREPSPGSKRKLSHSKSEGDMGDNQNDAREIKRTCLPHIEVERKYCEPMNLEFERLPATVPTLSELGSETAWVASNQSKVAATMDYRRCLEGENDMGLMGDAISIACPREAKGATVTDNGNYDDTIDELLMEWTTVYK